MRNKIQQPELGKLLPSHEVIILPGDQIDVGKWDNCVSNSVNESPLAYSWVMNCLAPGWKALIFGDYKGVMPLPVANNMGLNFVQMPFDLQNLGIYSSDASIANIESEIFKLTYFKSFPFISYSFMPKEEALPKQDQAISFRNTFELNLNDNYNSLKNNYSKSHKKNLKRFARYNLTIDKNKHPEAYKLLQQKKVKEKAFLFTPDSHNNNFNKMVKTALKNGQGEIYTISEGSLVRGAAFFLSGNKRTIVFHFSDEKGREMKTTFGLIDHFINLNAGTDTILDFAGSDNENIANFNRGFGADHKYYLSVQINHLPFLFKLIKKTNLRFRMIQFFHLIQQKMLKERKFQSHT